LLPLSAYINETNSQVKINECKIKYYLEKIVFPKGVSSISEFQRQIQKHKTFIPISLLYKEKKRNRERLASLFEEKIYETLGNVAGARSALWYPISELITNIFEHSKKNSGYLFGQYYPIKKYLDICIVDCGRGIRKSYEEEKGLNLTDEQAIAEAMKGHSVKKEKERGYGLRTSKEVVCKALDGSGFILISGSCALVSTKKGDRLVALSDFYWQGTIVSYRIHKPTRAVDFLKYTE